MKISVLLIPLITFLSLTSCSTIEQPNQGLSDQTSPTITEDITEDILSDNTYYTFDVSKDWDASDYEDIYNQNLHYFSAPILSPYKYTYICKDPNMSIDDIAYELGLIMMDTFMEDIEGKAFTVTEYRNLTANVMDDKELDQWAKNYRALVKNVVILENQWLCDYSCDYKYTGVYAGIGEMPSDMEWMNILTMDGSGENYIFIIQNNSDDEYIMRAMPKTVMEEMVDE